MTYSKYVAPAFNDEMKLVAFPQNLPSIIVSHVLNPQPGEVVLDMCAAPGNNNEVIINIKGTDQFFFVGGKTLHIAMLMKDQVRKFVTWLKASSSFTAML